jgi:hypothetical protein
MNGKELKDLALKNLELKRFNWLQICRRTAIKHAQKHGTVSINDIRKVHILPPNFHPNTWGAVFRCGFRVVGTTTAKLPQSHGRAVKVFALL